MDYKSYISKCVWLTGASDVPFRVVSGYVLSSLSRGGYASSYSGLGSYSTVIDP
jgi:hypothetical protein